MMMVCEENIEMMEVVAEEETLAEEEALVEQEAPAQLHCILP